MWAPMIVVTDDVSTDDVIMWRFDGDW